MRVEIVAEEASERAKICGIAVSLIEFERPDRRRGFHACIGAEMTPIARVNRPAATDASPGKESIPGGFG